jgi:hypothetical protein
VSRRRPRSRRRKPLRKRLPPLAPRRMARPRPRRLRLWSRRTFRLTVRPRRRRMRLPRRFRQLVTASQAAYHRPRRDSVARDSREQDHDRVIDAGRIRHLRRRRPLLTAPPRTCLLVPVKSVAHPLLGPVPVPPAGCQVGRYLPGVVRVHHVPGTTRSRLLRAWASPGRHARAALRIKVAPGGHGRRWAVLPRRPEADPGSLVCRGRIRP